MRTLRTSLAGLALCAPSLAQDPAQRLAPPPRPVVHMQMVGFESLDSLMQKSKLGQMLTEGVLKDVYDGARARADELGAQIEAVHAQIRAMGEDDDLHELEALAGDVAELEMKALDAYIYVALDEQDEPQVSMLVIAESGDENREAFDKLIAKAREITADEDVEPLSPLQGVDRTPIHLDDLDEDMQAWWLDTGTQTVFCVGDLDLTSQFARADTAPTVHSRSKRVVQNGGMAMHVDLALVGELIRAGEDSDFSREFGPVVEALGIDGDILSIGYDVDDEGYIRENMFFGFENGARGLIAAMTTAADKAPNVPLPSPALLHWTGALDMEKAFDAIRKATKITGTNRFEDEDAPIQPADLTKTFSGGMAFGISAPKPGAAIPRIGMAIRITDADAFAAFRTKLEEVLEGIGFDDHTYEGITWTSVEIPNNPAPMVPSFAVHEGMLLVGENPTTLKEMLKISLAGEVGPPIDASKGPSPLPAALGVQADPCLTYDLGAAYEMILEQYMPMVQMGMSMAMAQQGRGGEPLFTVDDLPDPDELGPMLGVGVGGMTLTDEGLHISVASTLSDPITAIMAEFMGPLMGEIMAMGMEQAVSQAEMRLAKLRLEKVYSGLRNWQTTWGSGTQWPRDLGELMGRALIDDPELLLAPGNDETLTLEYEDEDGEIQSVKTSYQWRPNGKLKAQKSTLEIWDDLTNELVFDAPWIQGDDESVTILLYEAQPGKRNGRMVMTADGDIYHIPEEAFQDILNG